jgi:hypothetical protein
MPTVSWLTKITDFVNLGKILVDAGPGFILALALYVGLGTALNLPLIPVHGHDAVESRLAGELEKRRQEEEGLEGQALHAEQGREAAAAAVSGAEAALTRAKASPLGGKAERRLVVELQRLQGDLREKQRSAKAAERKLRQGSEAVAEAKAALADAKKAQVTSVADLLSRVLEHLVALGLVGYVLGTLLSPVNRWVFLDTMGSDPASNGLDGRPSSYFVGKGVVSQTELDGLVTSYYRFAEASANMILPILALALAVGIERRSSVASTPWTSGAAALLVLAFVVFLAVTGRRRYRDYKTRVHSFITGRLEKVQAADDDRRQGLEKARTLEQVVKLAEELLKKTAKPGSPTA